METSAQNVSNIKKVTLIICDGWGVAEDSPGNAIIQARPAFFDYLLKKYPSTLLQASSNAVGLPWGEMGNSEVGHYTIGTGRIIKQSLYRINHEIESNRFYENTALLKTMLHVKKNNSALHIMGILGTGGVHGTSDHIFPILDMAKKQKVKKVFIHFFLDGRDSPKDSAIEYLKDFKKEAKKHHRGIRIASLAGRFFAMDRNNTWERIEKAYNAIVDGVAENSSKDPFDAIKESYKKDIFDENLEPTVIQRLGKPVATVNDGDGIVFYNFRSDRARQMTMAFTKKDFNRFPLSRKISNLSFTTFTKHVDGVDAQVAFGKEVVNNFLADVLSKNKFTQLHVAETEKYAHVSYFFNALKEEPVEGEDRELIPSPVVQSFATIPQMASVEVADAMVTAIYNDTHDFYLMNFAPADMVGHTGDLEATIQAIKIVDEQLKKVVEQTLESGGVAIITADHGNAEAMRKYLSDGESMEHTTNPVPLMIIDDAYKGMAEPIELENFYLKPVTGVLADVAPTILSYYNLPPGDGMTGVNLREVIL